MSGASESSLTKFVPFFVVKWIKVIFYMSILITRKVLAVPRRKLRKILASFQRGPFEEEDVRGKVVIVTGANSGIGKEVALEMAKRHAIVVMACRNLESCKAAIVEIRNETFFGTLIPMKLDLCSLASVRKFAEEVSKKFEKIDILINNAGVVLPDDQNMKTEDGFEIHFGVNHLAPFLLTNLLLDKLRASSYSRIVNVSSLTLKLGTNNFENKNVPKSTNPCCPNLRYANSKLAMSLFSYELAKRLKSGSTHGNIPKTYSLCPGIAATNIDKELLQTWLAKKLSFLKHWLFLSAKTASQTVLYCALSKDCSRQNGEIYRRCKLWQEDDFCFPDDLLIPGKLPFFKDEDAKKLWELSEKLCQIKYKL